MRHVLTSVTGLIALFAVLLPGSGESAPVLYTFSGQVSASTSGSFPVAIGDAIMGTFIYDPDAPAMLVGTNFAYFSPTTSEISATLGGLTYASSGYAETLAHQGTFGGISVPDGVYDVFEFAPLDGSIRPFLTLFDTDGTVFSALGSLPSQLPLGQFEYAEFSLLLEDGQVGGAVVLTQASSVPEPTSLMLFGTGLIGLALAGRSAPRRRASAPPEK